MAQAESISSTPTILHASAKAWPFRAHTLRCRADDLTDTVSRNLTNTRSLLLDLAVDCLNRNAQEHRVNLHTLRATFHDMLENYDMGDNARYRIANLMDETDATAAAASMLEPQDIFAFYSRSEMRIAAILLADMDSGRAQ